MTSVSVAVGGDRVALPVGNWLKFGEAPEVCVDCSFVLNEGLLEVVPSGFILPNGTKEEETGDDWLAGAPVPGAVLFPLAAGSIPEKGVPSLDVVCPSDSGWLEALWVEASGLSKISLA